MIGQVYKQAKMHNVTADEFINFVTKSQDISRLLQGGKQNTLNKDSKKSRSHQGKEDESPIQKTTSKVVKSQGDIELCDTENNSNSVTNILCSITSMKQQFQEQIEYSKS